MAENPTDTLIPTAPDPDRDVTPEKPPVTPWEIVWNIPDDWLERG